MNKHGSEKWNGFLKEVGHLISFWIFGVLTFTLHRAIFIFLFRMQIKEGTSFEGFVSAFFTGFRFDSTALSYFIILPLAATLVLSPYGKFNIIRRVRKFFLYAFVILTSIICVATISYYKEFNDQFNNFLFLGMHDDQKAIVEYFIEYHHPIANLLILLGAIAIGFFILRFFEKRTFIYNQLKKIKDTKYTKVVVVLLLLILFAGSIRGTYGRKPTTRKYAARTTDIFLNKTVMNPYRALKYAYSDYRRISSIEGGNPFGEVDLAKLYGADKVSDVVVKKAQGSANEKPKQVFMIIMESYDFWPMMDKYRSLDVAPNMQRIAEGGTLFHNFLPSYHATYYAYASIISGIPCFGLNINTLSRSNEPYISSIFTQFKKLGYKTNMFYGGYTSWENIGNFTDDQGCDNMYTGSDIDAEIEFGGWAVHDEKLFELILDKVDPDEYTFNLILTSSNHAPFSIDVYEKGFKYKTMDNVPEEMRKEFHDGGTLLELGHFWYGDWTLGEFMKVAEKKYDTALFGFTGDHYSRRHINGQSNLFETSAVPFILYGNGVAPQKLDTPGGHADILPTLIELVAPKDFEYYSFGTSMFDPAKKIGVGCETAVTDSTLFYFPPDAAVQIIDTNTLKESDSKTFQHQKEYDEIMRLSWHYIVNGNSLKKK